MSAPRARHLVVLALLRASSAFVVPRTDRTIRVALPHATRPSLPLHATKQRGAADEPPPVGATSTSPGVLLRLAAVGSLVGPIVDAVHNQVGHSFVRRRSSSSSRLRNKRRAGLPSLSQRAASRDGRSIILLPSS